MASLVLAAGHNFDDFQFVARIQLAGRKLRGRNGLAIVLHHHAARQKLLGQQKLFNGAGKLHRDWLSIGDDGI